MKIVAFVPIKLNSQRLPNKMLLPLGNMLLFQHIFQKLLDVKKHMNIDIYCYCSNISIKDMLPDGVIFLQRDEKFDSNDMLGIDIYKSFVNLVDSDIYILCHATSPFIKSVSIMEGLNKVLNLNYDSAFSVSKIQTFSWFQNKPLNYDFNNVVKTQDIEPIYWETSAFYIFEKNILMKHNRRIGFNSCMVVTDRIESIDIDEMEDYELATKMC